MSLKIAKWRILRHLCHCDNFLTKLLQFSWTTLLHNKFIRCWTYSTFWFMKTLENSTKVGKRWKIDNIRNFCRFRSEFELFFSLKKLPLISHKCLLDNIFFPFWPFSTFPSTKFIENLTKTAWKRWKSEKCCFGYFCGHFGGASIEFYGLRKACWLRHVFAFERFQYSNDGNFSKTFRNWHKERWLLIFLSSDSSWSSVSTLYSK